MKSTKLTIEIAYDLKTLKKCYAKFYGIDNYKSVLKSDIAAWASALVEADLRKI